MRIGISFNENVTIADQRLAARQVEAAGMSSLWTSDGAGRDPFLVCMASADATSTLQVGAGVAQIFTRTPAQVAKAAATLQDASGGRFLLGLGVSQGSTMRDWHGLELRRPYSAAREALGILRALSAGETTDHDGSALHSHGFRLAISPLPPPAPLYLGAMKPKTLALAGTDADGALLSWETVESIARAGAIVRSAAAEAGRDAPEIAAYVRVAVADDREAAKRALATQVAGYWQYYAEHFAHQGLEDAVRKGDEVLASGGGVPELAAALDDDILLPLGWYGTPKDDVGSFIERFEAAGLDHLIARVVPVADPVEALGSVLRALA